MAKSTQSFVPRKAAEKPAKPHPDFPLFPHATKRWAKKINGKFQYFGPWDQPEKALALWNEQKGDLLAGLPPRVVPAKTKAKKKKPGRPDGFPLFPHATGRWAKKVRGKLHYFGKWDDPQAALEKWLEQKDDLLAGRTPRVLSDSLTIRDLVNKFLNSKRLQVEAAELTARSWADYYATCERIVKCFGRNRLAVIQT